MKRMRIPIQVFVLISAVFLAGISYAGIASTVHNMSSTSGHAVEAQPTANQPSAVQGAEQEICVFCHTPHKANNVGSGAPLWNHNMTTSTYTMYQSDYLTRMGYSPTTYNPATAQPGLMSLVCLSCHDGTVGVGGIYAYKNSVLGTALLMTGADVNSTTGKLLSTVVANFGTNLTTHHPVGIAYNSTVSYAFGNGSRTIELLASPTAPLVLYSNKVECSSCHDPHIQGYGKFLRVTSGANLAANVSTTCTSCHNKTGWTGSAHQSLTYNYVDTNVAIKFGTGAMSSLACMNCHQDHKGSSSMYLLRQQWSRSCFQGAGANNTECHATTFPGDTSSLAAVFGRAARHPIVSDGVSVSKHTDLDVTINPTSLSTGGLDWQNARHAECFDCHNPHQAKNTPQRVASGSWYPTTPLGTSNQTSNSGPLTGVTGVDMSSYPAMWQVPNSTSYWQTYESATKEYQICFKCHSWYALQEGASGVSSYNTTNEGAAVTDQAMEFNPNNRAAHPVVFGLNSQPGRATYTGATPANLGTGEMDPPWNATTGVGVQTMYCSDCHGADNEVNADPKGPHGSSRPYMLKGAGTNWPRDANGHLYTVSGNCLSGSVLDGSQCLSRNSNLGGADTGLFCNNCHVVTASAATPHAKTASTDAPCISCHPVIPHGWKRSRFIAYTGEATTYPVYVSSSVVQYLSGFQKVGNGAGYVQADCYSTNSACSSAHSKVPTYSEP